MSCLVTFALFRRVGLLFSGSPRTSVFSKAQKSQNKTAELIQHHVLLYMLKCESVFSQEKVNIPLCTSFRAPFLRRFFHQRCPFFLVLFFRLGSHRSAVFLDGLSCCCFALSFLMCLPQFCKICRRWPLLELCLKKTPSISAIFLLPMPEAGIPSTA